MHKRLLQLNCEKAWNDMAGHCFQCCNNFDESSGGRSRCHCYRCNVSLVCGAVPQNCAKRNTTTHERTSLNYKYNVTSLQNIIFSYVTLFQ